MFFVVVYYRFLVGRWRKIGLPLVCNVHPREDKQSCSTSAQVVHEECVRRSLPVLQLGSDHFVGIHDAVRPALRGARSVTSLWHMMRNIQKNQRTRVWLGEDLPSRCGQVQKQPSPKINNRPLGVVKCTAAQLHSCRWQVSRAFVIAPCLIFQRVNTRGGA